METRNEVGQFTAKGMPTWEKKVIIAFAAIAFVYLTGMYISVRFMPAEIVAINNPVAHADTVKQEVQGLTTQQLEDKLDAIVWGGETDKYNMADGEILPVFDPPASMYNQCIKIGGKQNKDCLSYGPRQEKIGTIEAYWPKFNNGAKLTDKDARDIAESNDGSKRFFLDCAEQVKGCADNWTTFENKKDEGQVYLDLIRKARGIKI